MCVRERKREGESENDTWMNTSGRMFVSCIIIHPLRKENMEERSRDTRALRYTRFVRFILKELYIFLHQFSRTWHVFFFFFFNEISNNVFTRKHNFYLAINQHHFVTKDSRYSVTKPAPSIVTLKF